MKKSLYFLRHSYAESPGATKDFDRPLTPQGHNAARALGRYLSSLKLDFDGILCSPAVRTVETAVDILEELDVNQQIMETDDIIYDASVRELLEVINGIESDLSSVLIIGHNPAITFISEYVTGYDVGALEPASFVSATSDLNWKEISKGSCSFIGHYHPLKG